MAGLKACTTQMKSVSSPVGERVHYATPVVFARPDDFGSAGQSIAVVARPDAGGLDGDADRLQCDVERLGDRERWVKRELDTSVAHIDELRAAGRGIHFHDARHRFAWPAPHRTLCLTSAVDERPDVREEF